MKRIIYYFLFLTLIILFVSCQSTTGVNNSHRLIFSSEIKSEGNIYLSDKKNDNDIFISTLYTSESKFRLFGIQNAKCRDKIKVYYQDSIYPIEISYTKVIDKAYTHNVYSNIKIKKLSKEYKITELQPTGINSLKNSSDFSINITKELMPIDVTSFQIKNKVFYIIASKYYEDLNKHNILDLLLLKNQQFIIIDELGIEYASFTKTDYKIYDQPDSENYVFIPLIASYSYIFSMVK